MPIQRQIEAQSKRERALVKRNIISTVMDTILHILHNSQLYGSSLWPKNGFKTGGYVGHESVDTITIGIVIQDNSEYKKVRFNIWGKEARVLKQRKQLVLIFDQAILNGIYFHPEYPVYVNELSAHYHENYIMDMLDFKFTITT